MLLKKISLNNIRSYKSQEVEFPEGSILLSGDIGSGKTSILLAIEFALFGLQPGQRGSALLKNGEEKGGVLIEFEVDGKEIIIERTLKKGKTISQDYAAITIDGEKQEISVTELKSRVLEILNYPKEFSKKQNLLYKFTVYTPQEEMKQIILQDTETRINTLRHIFGIDKYKKIIENTATLTSKLREEKRHKEGMTFTIEQDKLNIISMEKELKSKQEQVQKIEIELLLKTEIRKKAQAEKEEISGKINEKSKLQQESEKTKLIISTKESAILDNKKEIERLHSEITELKKLFFEEDEFNKIEQEISKTKKEKKEMEKRILEISSRITSLNLKNQENELIIERLKHIEVCPTCLQDVNLYYKSNVVNKLNSNTLQNKNIINELNLEKVKFSNGINEFEKRINLNEKKIQELNISKVRLQTIGEKEKRIHEKEKLISGFLRDVALLNSQLIILTKSILELKKYDILIEEKQKQLEEAIRQEKITEIKIAELKKEISLFKKQIDDFKEKIKQIEEIKKQLNYLIDLESWLSMQFSFVVSSIEKNVMNKLKSEFSKLFSEWFAMLVADNFNVVLDDDFTPRIELQDYSIDYSYLSGGERTAIALAYRLALNQVINSLLSNIKTKGFIILDEPTDGFSDAQLDKMRSVLEQLNTNQLIIVSHEQKIEGFVEKVIRFRKENGVSVVEA